MVARCTAEGGERDGPMMSVIMSKTVVVVVTAISLFAAPSPEHCAGVSVC